MKTCLRLRSSPNNICILKNLLKNPVCFFLHLLLCYGEAQNYNASISWRFFGKLLHARIFFSWKTGSDSSNNFPIAMYINASFLIYCDFFFWGTADPITIMVHLFKFGTSSQLYAFLALHQRWKKIKREMIWPRISEKNILTLVY